MTEYKKETIEVWTNLGRSFIHSNGAVRSQYVGSLKRILRNGAINQLRGRGVKNFVVGTVTRLFTLDENKHDVKLGAKYLFIQDIDPEDIPCVEKFIDNKAMGIIIEKEQNEYRLT